MGKNAENRIAGQGFLLLKKIKQTGNEQTGQNHTESQINMQQITEGNTKQR